MPIRRRLIILFLSVAIMPVLFIALLNFSNAKDELLTGKIERLEVIADLKVDKIENFFDALKSDMQIVQDYFNIKTNLPIVTRYSRDRVNPEYMKARAMLDGQLRTWLKVRKEMVDIMLVSPEGKVVYAVNRMHAGHLDQPLWDPEGRAFEEGKKGVYLSDVFRDLDPGSGYDFGMLVTAPAYDFEKRFIGVIAFEINMEPIYSFIQDTTGLGRTGETLIVQKKISRRGAPDYKGRDGEYVLFLNPLRHDPEAAFKRMVFMEEKKALSVQLAVKGKNGFGFSIDYRNKEILAAWRYIPSLNWGLVAKMDIQEILAPVKALKYLTIIICVIVGAIVGIIALVISNSISDPIHILHKGTEIIGSGNLDYKISTDAKDEIGQLSRAFDQMTDKLKAQMEETKAANQQLRASNQQLGASEQQLRAVNQQLRANEQQLRAEITEREQVEDALRHAEQEWRETFDSISDMVSIHDKNYKIIRANKSFEDMFKMELEDVIGKTCYELIHRSSEPLPTCPHRDTLETKKPQHSECFEPHLNRYLEISTSPILDGKGDLVGSVHIVRDISHRKKLEKSQRLTELGKLVADMAHEVNNPLMIISGNAQLSLLDGTPDEEIKNNLKIIHEESNKAKDIIQRLLKFSRPSKGERKEINITQSVESVIKLIEHQFSLSDVKIEKSLTDNLPLVVIDEKQIQEVLMNLLNNARDAMLNGGTVDISTSLEQDFIRIDVKDSGMGMDEEALSKVFEPFYTTKEKGTGLGLSVCHGIVKAHNGELKFKSEAGKGVTATVLLPIRGGGNA